MRMNETFFVSTQLQIWRRGGTCMLWGEGSVFAMNEDILGECRCNPTHS
jgi:hypothetical protein